jgi:hypothetical protein
MILGMGESVRRLLLILLIAFLGNQSVSAQCTKWIEFAGRADLRVVFQGTVGDRPVRMMLHSNEAAGQFGGSYGYNNQLGSLELVGKMQPNDAGIRLQEHGSDGRSTGTFDLQFFAPEQSEQQATHGCSSLTGTWTSPGEKKSLYVSLHVAGELNPANDAQRQLNEVAAFKLRKAMLEGNHATFASLLNYPFISEDRNHQLTYWENANDVIKNYSEIVKFSVNDIQSAVPHALLSSPSGSEFMGRSIDMSDGKVTRICESTCSM